MRLLPKARAALRAIVVAVTIVASIFIAGSAVAAVSPVSGSTAGGTSVTVSGIRFVKVSAGSAHSIGLTNQGTVYAWGVGSSGALGNGSTTSTSVPVQVSGVGGGGFLTGVTDISAGYNHNLALTSQGVVAWGRNVEGQLGIGTISPYSATPVYVLKGASPSSSANMEGVAAVSAGKYFSLALTQTGDVYSWGENASGQLGRGNTTLSSTATQVVGVAGNGFLSGVTNIDAGYDHALAVIGGSVFAWGANASGQLGDGSTTLSSTPVAVLKGEQSASGLTLSGAASISAGGAHSFALTSNGLYGWGGNASGQLGNNTQVNASAPVRVVKGASSSSTAYFEGGTQIEAGSSQSFVLNGTGLYSWGTNASGEAGNVVGGITPQPVVAIGGQGILSGVLQFSSGWAHSVVATTSGVASMGRGSTGRLGNGGTTDQNVPVLGPNFVVTSVTFGSSAASIVSTSGYSATVQSPAGSLGQVAVAGTSNLLGGVTAGSPATATWADGNFTYVAPSATPSSGSASNTQSSTELANTGATCWGSFGALALLLIFGGTVIRVTIRRRKA